MVVLKVGGNELDDESFLFGLAKAVQAVIAEGHFPVIVHGGGKAVTELGARLGIVEQRIEGLRVTDEASLDVAEMVLSGLMNKRIVRLLVNAGVRAAGISGVDDGTIYVEKMWHPLGDLGRVGEVQDVDDYLLRTLIAAKIVPVVSPISFGALDALSYNVNADHAATAIAAKLGAIKLVFISNVPGILVAGRVVRAVTARTGGKLDRGRHYLRRHDPQGAQRDRGGARGRGAGGDHEPGRRAGWHGHRHHRGSLRENNVDTQEVVAREHDYVLGVYGRAPFVLERGRGQHAVRQRGQGLYRLRGRDCSQCAGL